jgi:hypothetical protein
MLLIYRYLRAVRGGPLDSPAVFFTPRFIDSSLAIAPRLNPLLQLSVQQPGFPYRMRTARRSIDAARPSRVAGS